MILSGGSGSCFAHLARSASLCSGAPTFTAVGSHPRTESREAGDSASRGKFRKTPGGLGVFLMLNHGNLHYAPQLLAPRCFSNALVDRFEIQGCNLRQCHSAPKPELLSFDPNDFQRWLADELKVVVIPKELATLIEQGASLNIQSPSVRDVLQGFGQLPDKHAKLACKWLFEGRGENTIRDVLSSQKTALNMVFGSVDIIDIHCCRRILSNHLVDMVQVTLH